jgi:SAM-dependent methyltransferase
VVGGGWKVIGPHQLEYLTQQGLKPEHRLLDVGCGSLRGGLHFIEYLDPGHYFGMDRNAGLLKGGREELREAGLQSKAPTLIQSELFEFGRFHQTFDFALAQSVFTHLPFNTIMRCLSEMESALVPGGKFFATFFRNPGPRLRHDPMTIHHGALKYPDRDPYYYSEDIFRWAVAESTLDFEYIGDWGHPRQQEMVVFTKRS